VIGINLNGEPAGRKARFAGRETRLSLNLPESEFFQRITQELAPLKERVQAWLPENGLLSDNAPRRPNLFEVVVGSIDIMQDILTRNRLSRNPPDVLIEPHLGHMGLMEFDRATEAMEEGESAVEAADKAGALRILEG